MTTHDFRPGDVVEWSEARGLGIKRVRGTIGRISEQGTVFIDGSPIDLRGVLLTLISRGTDAPTEHPSRSRAASSLRAASASLTTAIDHLTRAGETETYPGQANTRTRTAAEETQACIHHATMALYWMLHERLGS